MFGFTKHEAEPEAPAEPSLVERFEANRLEIREADAEIARRDAALKKFAAEHDLILDHWGVPVKCKAVGGAQRDDLLQRCRELYVQRGEAGNQFYALLNVHAGLKLAMEGKAEFN